MKKLFLNIFLLILTSGFLIAQSPPTISDITNKTINEDATMGPINFTVGDAQTPVANLTLSATSSNTTIVPNGNISFGGSGADRTITIVPAANENSSNGVTITVTVTDGNAETASDNFKLYINSVNDNPTIVVPVNQTLNEDANTGSINFTVNDVEDGGSVTVTRASSNETIIPLSGLVLGGSGNNRTITITPAANQFTSGTPVTVTFTVTDGDGASTNGTFTVTVNPVNDVPSFTKGANVEVLQNSSAYSQAFATSLSTGPSNESSQVLSFTVTNNANSLFSVQPAVSASGVLTFTPATSQTGTATVTISVQDDGGTANSGNNSSANQTFTILITAVNQIPTINTISNVTYLEDAGVQTVNMAGISRGVGDASAQTISITATSNSTSIVGNPTVTYVSENTTGSLAVTPATNANTSSGPVTITVTVTDNGGTLFNGVDTKQTTFQVNITAVNDEPSFTKGSDLTVMQNSSAYSQAWATNLSKGGGSDEASQVLTFTVTNDANGLFSSQPAINSSGVLSFTPATNQTGTATVSIVLSDNGGTANSGDDTYATQTFTITIAQVNQEPVIDNIGNVTILEDASQQTVNLTGIRSNGNNLAWETNQTLTVTATSSNTTIIPNPTVTYNSAATTGSIAFTPNANQYGTVTISVTVTDNGGTSNGGDDVITKTFTVTTTNVNDKPSYTAGGNQTVLEDAGAQSASWASSLNKGTNEASQILSFVIQNNTNTALFSVQPAIDGSGTLSYTPASNKVGVATITVYIQDDGGTANSGFDNTSDDPKSFTITVTGVNDEPIINTVSDITVNEDASLQTISLSGIGAGGGTDENSQTLSLNVTSSNTTIIPTPTITYSSANPTGTLNYTPAANQFTSGSPVVLTVTLQDNGGTANGGDDTKVITININVTSVNDQPTLADITNPTVVLEDAGGNITVNLSGIGSGAANETQTLSVTATSSDAAVIPNPSVTYSSANATGSLTLTPQADQNGIITITVTVSDGGATNSTISKTFQVTITAVNDSPSFTKGANQTVLEDVTTQTISSWATSIKKGPTNSSITNENSQVLTFVISTNTNTALFDEQPAISATGDLTYKPALNKNGSATITAYLDDNGGTANGGDNSTSDAPITFSITVTAVNDEPTLTKPIDITIDEDAGTQTVNLTGIGVGGGTDEVGQFLIVSATSGNTTIIPTPTITSYVSPNTTGTLTFRPADGRNTSGISPIILTVRVSDDGGTLNSGDDLVEKTFNVTINSVNDPPTWITISDSSIAENEPADAVIGTLSSTDEDVGQSFTYTLVSGIGSDDNASFQILNDKLKALESYNYEAKNRYTIRIRTTDSGTPEKFFERAITVLIEDINEQPVLVYPESSSVRIAISSTLKWRRVLGAIDYRMEIYEQSHTATTIDTTLTPFYIGDITGGDTIKAITNFKNYKKYFWRVRSRDNRNNISLWSYVWNFRTLIGAPIHNSPVDNKLWVKVRDSLQWRDTAKVATRYDIQISQTIGFTTGVRDVANIDSSLKIHYYDSLTTNLTYYWKMRARNSSDTSLWTTAWKFRVVPRKPQVDSVVVAKNQFNFASDSLRILYYPNGDVGDTVSLVLDYSLNNGLTWFATTNILVSSAKSPINNLPTLMGWLSKKDFSFIENDSVKVRITLVGIGGAGTPRASSVFSLDNNPPTFGGLTTAFAETTGNAITITWLKGTDKNSPLRYYIYYVQTDSTLINYNSPRDSIIDDSPTTHTKTITGFQNYKKYYLAVRARDRADNFDKNEILKSATPSKPVRLLSVTTPQKIVKDSVYIPFLVNAANDDTITFVGEFSKNDGVSWFSVAQLGGRATKVSNSNFNDSVLWRTKSDGEFIESQTTKFRLTAYGLAVNSQPLTTNKFTVDNTPPMIDSIKSVVNNTQNIAGSVTVSWTKSTDMSSPTSYQLYVNETSTYNSNTPTRVFPLTKPTSDIDSMWIPKLKAMTKYYFTLWYRDSLGNLDSTKVAKTKQFTTGILTDYTNDGRILTEDLGVFSNAWKTGNKNVGDISPNRGTFPVISIDNDGLIDLEDLTLFVRIWNWAFVNGKGGTLSNSLAKGSNANESEGNISTGESKLLKDGKTLSIPLFVTGVKSFDAMNLMLNYNTNSVKVDSFVLNNGLKKYFGESIVALFNSDSKYGLTTTAFANLGFKELTPETTTELGVLYATIKNNIYEGSFSGGFEIYSFSKNINQNGTLSLNYKTEPILPKIFALEQNYPNPFNPKTNIKFALPVPSNVKIEIYNILGEKVIELVNQQHNAGLHTVEWNANVSSGLYFYRINAESIDKTRRFVQTKKMLFLK